MFCNFLPPIPTPSSQDIAYAVQITTIDNNLLVATSSIFIMSIQYLIFLFIFSEKEKLLSPLLLVEELASCTDSVGVNLGAIRSYLKTVLTNERSIAEKEHALANKYRKETAKIRDRIREIQSK